MKTEEPPKTHALMKGLEGTKRNDLHIMGKSNSTEEYVGTAESCLYSPVPSRLVNLGLINRRRSTPNVEQLRKPKPNSIPEDEIFYTPFEVIGEESTSFGFSSFDMTTDAALVDAVALLEGAVPVDGDDITPQGDTTPPSLFGTPIY